MNYGDHAFREVYHDTPVRQFHEVFGHPISWTALSIPDMKTRTLRVQMLASELVELCKAFSVDLKIDSTHSDKEDECVLVRARAEDVYDPVEAADALGDLRYIVDGGNLVCGFPGTLVLNEIHRSNMSKLDADGKPIVREDGKIMKGPNYTKPDIRKVLGLPEVKV